MLSHLYRRLPSGFINYQNFKIMSHQKFHFIRSNQSSTLIAILFLFLIFSCNQNDDKNVSVSTTQQDTGQVVSNDTATRSAAPLTSATVPKFRIERSALNDLFESAENYKKLIIKLGVNDFSDFSRIELLVYPVKNHAHHGSGTNPIPNITTEGTTNIDEPLIIGNNYVKLKKILKKLNGTNRDFTYLLLTPMNGAGPNENQLVFDLKAVTVENKNGVITILSTEDLGDTNPSPPADPLSDN